MKYLLAIQLFFIAPLLSAQQNNKTVDYAVFTKKKIQLELNYRGFPELVDTFLVAHKNTFIYLDDDIYPIDSMVLSIGKIHPKKLLRDNNYREQCLATRYYYIPKGTKKKVPVVFDSDLAYSRKKTRSTFPYSYYVYTVKDSITDWTYYWHDQPASVNKKKSVPVDTTQHIEYLLQLVKHYADSLIENHGIDSVFVYSNRFYLLNSKRYDLAVFWEQEGSYYKYVANGCSSIGKSEVHGSIDFRVLYDLIGDERIGEIVKPHIYNLANFNTFCLLIYHKKEEDSFSFAIDNYYLTLENDHLPFIQLVKRLEKEMKY